MFILCRVLYRFHIFRQKRGMQNVLENKENLYFSLLTEALHSKSKLFVI